MQLIARDLESILEVVDPVGCADAFGPRIHQLLLAACSEVEASWVGVLRANHYLGAKRFTTKDFVKLSAPMRLPDYLIELEGYPDYPGIRPFEVWQEDEPTKSLPWYDAYNKVKHDRENHASEGSLKHVIEACAAVLIMAVAQFGQEPFLQGGKFEQKTLYVQGAGCFLEGEPYHGPYSTTGWTKINYPL